MGVARLPTETNGSSDLTKGESTILEAIFNGHKPREIAKRLAPHDKAERRRIRARLRRLIQRPEFAAALHARGQLELAVALGPTIKRLAQRAAATGKPDAVKLVFEASGFHNPRVKHDHTGSVEIKLTIPRPALPEQTTDHVDAEDVEVVEPTGTQE
jgi:hypothetical protein